MNKQSILKAIGPIVLVLAILAAVIFVKTKPVAQRQRMSSMIPVVEVADLQKINAPVTVECMGTVIADSVADIQAEVKGLVRTVHPDLVAGAFIAKGELLIEIDPRDYEQAVRSAEAALKTAQSNLRIEEGRQATAKHEMELIGGGEVDEAYRDLMLRTPQLEAVRASVDSAQAALASAQSALDRTKIRAPFDAVVQMENIAVGDYAQVGRTLMELVSTHRFFVRASIPVSDLKFFPMIGIYDANGVQTDYTARLIAADGAERSGTLYKMMPGLTEQGRMAQLLIAINRPLADGGVRPMLLGESVRVELAGMEQDNVCVIDRKYLRDGSVVWMMDPDHKLRICPAEVIRGYADKVMIRLEFSKDCQSLRSLPRTNGASLVPLGWKLVTSNMSAPVDGMQLKTQDDLSEARP